MQSLQPIVNTAVSAWTFDSDSTVYLASEDEAATVVDPLVNSSDYLMDPPRLRDVSGGDVGTQEVESTNSPDELTLSEDERRSLLDIIGGNNDYAVDQLDSIIDQIQNVNPDSAEPQTSSEALPQTLDGSVKTCSYKLRSDASRLRKAPSTESVDQNMNTVEIVKKNGAYSVVVDGVSQGEIRAEEGTGKFGKRSYWLPRFKEARLKTGQRTVQPVLFSLRIEDYELAPESCRLEVRQRVVDNGQVLMDDKVISVKEIASNSTSSVIANATLVPYPIISTRPPHVTINDYRDLMRTECMAKLYWKPGFFNAMMEAIKSIPSLLDSPVSSSLKISAKSILFIFTILKRMTLGVGSSVASSFSTAAKIMFAGRNFTSVATAMFTDSVAGSYSYMMLQAMAALTFRGTGEWTWDTETRDSFMAKQADAALMDPVTHTITIRELPIVIHKIAETRANGNMLVMNNGLDNTVGHTLHDLEDDGWHTEAALLRYLMYGPGERKGRDEVTGLYSMRSRVAHAQSFRSDPYTCPLTMTTIGLQGMDVLTLSNTRTQFCYVIVIQDQDGNGNLTIEMEATRMNGVDAGWIAAGYDTDLQLCKEAVDCLEERLVTLPQLYKWIHTSSMWVIDSSDGLPFGGRGFVTKDVLSQLRTRSTEQIQKAKDEAKKRRQGVSENVLNQEKLEREVAGKLLQLDQEEATWKRSREAQRGGLKKKYDKKMLRTPLEADLHKKEYDDEMRKIHEAERKGLRNFEVAKKKVQKEWNEVASQYKNSNRYMRGAMLKEQGIERLANVFEVEPFLRRLRVDIIGENYEASVETIEEQREQSILNATFWSRMALRMFGQVSDSDKHIEYCHAKVCLSLGINPSEIEKKSVFVSRFIRNYSPLTNSPDADAMRLSAFAVPTNVWNRTSYKLHEVLRTMPSIVKFDVSRISTFGKVSIVTPTRLQGLLEPHKYAEASIKQASDALRRTTQLIDIHDTQLQPGSQHFSQVYVRSSGWALYRDQTFRSFVRHNHLPVDIIPASMLPVDALIIKMLQFESAGSRPFLHLSRLVSGSNSNGVAAILNEMRLPVSISSLTAVAIFCEIVTYNVLARSGTQKSAVATSSLAMASSNARAVADFIKKMFNKTTTTNLNLFKNDVCFHCIPGMAFVRVALRRIGAFNKGYTLTSVNVSHANAVSYALARVASNSQMVLSRLPFTCVQSVLTSLNPAVQLAMQTRDVVNANVIACEAAFKRVTMAAKLLDLPPPICDAVIVDVICAYPVVLKVFEENQEYVFSASVSQKAWKRSQDVFSQSSLAYRLASLRLEVQEEHPLPTKTTTVKNITRDMNKLSFKTFQCTANEEAASYMIPYGLVETGTSGDIAHMSFDVRPVWLELLISAAKSQQVFSSSFAVTAIDLDPRGASVRGRPVHPFVLQVTNSSVKSYLHKPIDVQKYTQDQEAPFSYNGDRILDVHSLSAACQIINSSTSAFSVSGALSEAYGLMMHNCERLFQCALAVSAESVKRPNSNLCLRIPRNWNRRSLIASACVANCMCNAYASSGVQIAVKMEEELDATEDDTLIEIARMAELLVLSGVKAMPFKEVCMLMSLL